MPQTPTLTVEEVLDEIAKQCEDLIRDGVQPGYIVLGEAELHSLSHQGHILSTAELPSLDIETYKLTVIPALSLKTHLQVLGDKATARIASPPRPAEPVLSGQDLLIINLTEIGIA